MGAKPEGAEAVGGTTMTDAEKQRYMWCVESEDVTCVLVSSLPGFAERQRRGLVLSYSSSNTEMACGPLAKIIDVMADDLETPTNRETIRELAKLLRDAAEKVRQCDSGLIKEWHDFVQSYREREYQ